MRHNTCLSTHEAVALHETVSPARWCVTRGDVRQLQREIHAAIARGSLQTDGSEDDGNSSCAGRHEFGPSIYIVNEQYIKPVTAEAGKMSWALMRNPEGLDCDLFVSHAWQEGIFEFLSKLRGSWPWRAQHAWCCMLANPQHLNISSMLQSPRASPFALALQSSRYVLVIPNRQQSIYCRLWCGYEAYVASQEDKTIQIAAASVWSGFCWTVLLFAAVPLSLGLLVGILANIKAWDIAPGCMIVICIAAFCTAYAHGRLRQVANYAGLAAGMCLEVHYDYDEFHDLGIRIFDGHFTFASLFLIAEFDRVRSLQIDREGQQLRKQYDGSIRFASCSQETDQRNIWDEIGDKVEEVDRAIDVLISAGMSSPALRTAAKSGVDVKGAGHAELAIAFTVLGPLQGVNILQTIKQPWPSTWFGRAMSISAAVGSLARLTLTIILCFSPTDQRRFILKVLTKLVATVLFLLVFSVITIVFEWRGAADAVFVMLFVLDVIFVLSLFFGALGIDGTLALPGGTWILQYFLRRQADECDSCGAARSDEMETDEESSEEESVPGSGPNSLVQGSA
ncbi:unnamed protein product [Durusdinium trenchii]|uniref:Uncharacterized protein n=1 Tax=Durusdinium trenchii TaxID=1381693 RepID=A0ABP0PWM2_9DINO